MALKEQKVIQEITICDLCNMPVNDTGTHIEGSASGYMKRENWMVDLCENCASKVGLKRRGRKPAAAAPAPKAEDGQPKRKRGRPRKNPVEGEAAPKKRGPGRPRKQEAEQKEFVAVGAGANDDDGWEA